MIIDTSALIAFFDSSESDHAAVSRAIDAATDELVVSPYVLAEVDHLIASRFGTDSELAALAELTSGAWELAQLELPAIRRAITVVSKYADQQIGIADASLVVLADDWQTKTIVTLDRRHFEVLRPLTGGRFTLLP